MEQVKQICKMLMMGIGGKTVDNMVETIKLEILDEVCEAVNYTCQPITSSKSELNQDFVAEF